MNRFKPTEVSTKDIGSDISNASMMVLMSNHSVEIFVKFPTLTYRSHSNLYVGSNLSHVSISSGAGLLAEM